MDFLHVMRFFFHPVELNLMKDVGHEVKIAARNLHGAGWSRLIDRNLDQDADDVEKSFAVPRQEGFMNGHAFSDQCDLNFFASILVSLDPDNVFDRLCEASARQLLGSEAASCHTSPVERYLDLR